MTASQEQVERGGPVTEAGKAYVAEMPNMAARKAIGARIAIIEAEMAETVRQPLFDAVAHELKRLVGLADKYMGPGPGSVGSMVDLQNVYGSFEAILGVLATTKDGAP